jgi:4-amino-4-deoxy-L-arabinose transferase-like glycosyltransferase
MFAPWSFFIPAAVKRIFRQPALRKDKLQLLLCWAATIFIFFSIPSSKLPYYILPMSMPLAILIGALFADWTLPGAVFDRGRFANLTWHAIPVAGLLCFLGINAYLFFTEKEARVLTLQPYLHLGSAILFAGGLLAFFFYKKARIQTAIFSLAGMAYAILILIVVGMKVVTPFESSYAFIQELKPQLKDGDTVAIFASPDRFSDIPYYLKRRIMVVGDRGTLSVPTQRKKYAHEVKKWFLTDMEFSHFFNDRSQRVFCLMETENLQYLQQAGIKDFTVLKEGHEKILISNIL